MAAQIHQFTPSILHGWRRIAHISHEVAKELFYAVVGIRGNTSVFAPVKGFFESYHRE